MAVERDGAVGVGGVGGGSLTEDRAEGGAGGAGSKVLPAKRRLVTLDALRGFAILGILAPNIVAFSWPMAAMTDPSVIGRGWWSGFGHAVTATVFLGKFMFLFAMLFGAGVVLFDRKTAPKGGEYCGGCGYDRSGLPHGTVCPECGSALTFQRRPRLSDGAWLWHRRCAVLLGFGLVHAYLFWYGDILTYYAIAGLTLLWWVRKLPAALQVLGGLGLYVFGALLLLGMTAAGLWAVSEGQIGASDMMGGDPAEEIAAYLGSWWDSTRFRFLQTLAFQLSLGFVFMPALWGIMVLGMGLTKMGILTGERSMRFHASLGAVLVVVGGVLTAGVYAAVSDATEHAGFLWQGISQLVGVPLALGYSQVIVAMAKWDAARAPVEALARVGRMALSNYLLQTLVMTTLMYGYGFGLFAKVGYPGLFGLMLAMWIANFAFSALWLRRFRYGPAEWVWRTLTYLGRV